MSKDPWFRFFPSDWLGGTARLSAAERGVYITLLAAIYDEGGPIQRSDDRLSRICGLPKAGFRRALEALIDLGKIAVTDGMLSNSRAETELSERENLSARHREGANITNEKKRIRSEGAPSLERDDSETPSARSEDASRAGVPQPQPQPDSIPDSPSGESSSITAASVGIIDAMKADLFGSTEQPEVRKKRIRAESDLALLDRITDVWNPWAASHGLAQVQGLTDTRARACRQRLAYLKDLGYPEPIEAFQFVLDTAEQSFFIRGEPRNPLTFDQLLRESFLTKLLEGAFTHVPTRRAEWAR